MIDLKHTVIFTPLEGEDVGFGFFVVDTVSTTKYKFLIAKGFPIEDLDNDVTFVTGIFPNVGSRFDGLRGIFSKETS